jgi:hypothetical protein
MTNPCPRTLRAFALVLVSTLAFAGSAAWAAKPHQHGVARLDVAVEPGKVTIDLDTPLDNLLGFERAPRSDDERRRADAAVATLKAADKLLRIDPAAQCIVARVTLDSAALQLGTPDPKAAAEGHADLDASFEFACKGGAPSFVEIGLFEAFARLQRIEIQTATAKGQNKAVLKRPANRIGLSR